LETASLTEDLIAQVAASLGSLNFTDYTGTQFGALFESLDPLTFLDSAKVRNAYSDLFAAICSKMRPRQMKFYVLPMLEKLFAREWAGERACGVLAFAKTFSFLDAETRTVLFGAFLDLAKQAEPGLLRRALIDAATRLCGKGVDVIGAVGHFASDPSPTTGCKLPAFLDAYLDTGGDSEPAIGVGAALLTNPNWRVRFEFVRNISIFARLRDTQLFLDWFGAAASDPEEEVRAVLPGQIIAFDVDASAVFTCLVGDRSERVRFSVVEALGDYRDPEFAKATLMAAIRERPLILGRAVPTLKKLDLNVGDVVVTFMRDARHWRDREAIVRAIPELGIKSEELVTITFADEAIAVRYATIDVLRAMGFPQDFVAGLVGSAVAAKDYQMRQTALVCIAALGLWEQCADAVSRLAVDRVANVRLTLARNVPPDKADIVELLRSDQDEDVREAIGRVAPV
jgi:hypothetical protein